MSNKLTPDRLRKQSDYCDFTRDRVALLECADAWQADIDKLQATIERVAELENNHPPTNAGYWKRQHTRLFKECEAKDKRIAELTTLRPMSDAPRTEPVILFYAGWLGCCVGQWGKLHSPDCGITAAWFENNDWSDYSGTDERYKGWLPLPTPTSAEV